jgi:hypothetical protein
MAYEQKPGQGSIFKNDRKESENHPDYKGDGTCPCCKNKLWLDMWTKKPEGKKPYFSVSLKAKDAKPAAQAAPKQAPAPAADFDDSDIPFN